MTELFPADTALLDRLLAGTRSRAGGALVLRGETHTLLSYAVEAAHGMRVARLTGIESETGLGFAGLSRLLTRFAPGEDQLPFPGRAALSAVFTLITSRSPKRLLVGVAALDLLEGAAADRPLLVVVDEAQWLDPPTVEVLAFVARRLATSPVALLIAGREPIDGLPAVQVRGPAGQAAARAVLELGQGRYEAALESSLTVYRDDPPGLGTSVLPDLIEAAVRCGEESIACSAVRRLASRTADPGLLARSLALLTDGAQAENLYREAISLLRQGETVQLARAHLLYGEWLRRRRRRRDARHQLRIALDLFDVHGDFAERTRGELLASGEWASRRTGEGLEGLTPQEMRVARLVMEGSSNRQVAVQLFISPSTVEYHLQKVFRKVGVSSRTQLVRAMVGAGSSPTPNAA